MLRCIKISKPPELDDGMGQVLDFSETIVFLFIKFLNLANWWK